MSALCPKKETRLTDEAARWLTSVPLLRSCRTRAMADAFDWLRVNGSSVTKSWCVTGIPRALWSSNEYKQFTGEDYNKYETLYEEYVKAAKLTPGLQPGVIEIPQDDNESEEDEEVEDDEDETDEDDEEEVEEVLAPKRGRPPSGRPDVVVASRRIECEKESERIRQLPTAQRRLAESAKGTPTILSWCKPRTAQATEGATQEVTAVDPSS